MTINGPAFDTSLYCELPDKVLRAVERTENNTEIQSLELYRHEDKTDQSVYIELYGTIVPSHLITQVNLGRLDVKDLRRDKCGAEYLIRGKFEVVDEEIWQ